MSETADQDHDHYVGQQVHVIRRRRGMSQQLLADLVGLSRGAIAKYENGERPVDSRKVLHALALALDVNIGDLTGHDHDRFDRSVERFHTAVPDIETAIWTAGNVTQTERPRSLDQLTQDVTRATQLRIACDYASLGPMLAPMLNDCYRHTRDAKGAEQERAWDILAAIAHTTAAALKARGYPALSWTATQEADKAAEHVGGTAAFASAAFNRSQVLFARPGSWSAALECVESTADRLESDARMKGEIETLGMLHLQASLVTSALGGDPNAHLDEAANQARRLATAQAGTSILRNPTFGPANVELWRMSSAMERREPGETLELASRLNPETLPAAGRRAQYFIEVGRAHALRRDYRQSLNALLRAEHAAQQHVRGMSIVRELVGHMMRKARRDLTTGDLGRFAQRVGATPV
ncbi:Transcriptional regulator, contains XRE-family HTH domain [Nocardia amikacinitolerans]|uniref:helix-turn-helix domain-containing protein n=1 Tax=Nocardia amikacinitolerans TaxID=756689 RepID=UPI00082B4F3C|nr:helix-turn-helix transcriptional regulator [Nocardia amikacinitolerans]MCP2318432.1 Transcriptional regulator, contains XRE-family HTH domain [Nocardia amikacinitolerans]